MGERSGERTTELRLDKYLRRYEDVRCQSQEMAAIASLADGVHHPALTAEVRTHHPPSLVNKVRGEELCGLCREKQEGSTAA